MKKIVSILLAAVLMLGISGCGEYKEGSTATRDTYVEIDPGDVDINAEDTSTVTLLLNGMPITESPGLYEIFMNMEIYAQWSDGHTIVVSKFNEEGVAVASGLDGDYSVTLSDVPGDYTYNINGYTSDNNNRRINIDLYRILYGDGPGTGEYYPYIKELSDVGVYEITIDSPDQVVMCRFAPGISGIYSIESWVSVAEDSINPQYDHYYGSVAAVWYGYTLDDGGPEGSYTKNFKEIRTVSDDEIGNVFVFGVHATSKDGIYPIKVQVAVLRIGDMNERYHKTYMVPQEELRQALPGEGDFVDYWTPQSNGTYLLDSSKCRLWEVKDGGDGYYHIYDEAEYAATGGWGPTLYARITSRNIMEYSLSNVEWMGQGNSMLTLFSDNSYRGYKQFIEGFESLATKHGGTFKGTNYCVEICECHEITAHIFACQEFCEDCHSTCTQVLPELYGAPGYADAVNSDGVYPVTDELQQFLQLFAECHNLFCDGTGDAEVKGLASDQASMWLWCVGYYSADNGGPCEMGSVIPNYFD